MDESDLKRRVSSIGGSSDLPGADLPDNYDAPSGGKGLALAAMGVGIFGIIAGVVGIVMANGMSAQIGALKKQMEQQTDPVVSIQPKLDELDARAAQNAAETLRANRDVSDLNSRIQQLAKAIAADRTQINRNTAALAGGKAPVAPVSNTSGSDEQAAPVASGGQQIHEIESGDSFSSLARKYGVSISAIQEANPTADSKRLQIGQKIVIPASGK